MAGFWKRYKWYVIGAVLAYSAVTIWLFFATETAQNVPFQYQVF